jgi:Ca-activated chloride channel family protein
VLLAGCGQGPPTAGDATPTVQPSAEDRALVATGLAADQVAAARRYLAGFTFADPAQCYREIDLGGAATKAPAGGFADNVPPTRVVVAVDGSGSMAGRVGGRTKLELAREATAAFVDGLPADVQASLLVFGQQGDNSDAGKAKSCAGIDVLAPMSRDRGALSAAIGQVRAVGWTPLAAGLQRAQAQFSASSTPGDQVIYVVSDGLETCGGDPVAAARAINTGTTRAIVNIVGFGLPTGEAAALQAVAGAGGGRFVNITDDAQYRRTMAAIRESNRQAVNRIRASAATTRNMIEAGAAITRAEICTGAMVTRETLEVGGDLTRRTTRGETPPPRNVVFAVLDQRHKAIATQRDGYATRLRGARDTVNADVEVKRRATE